MRPLHAYLASFLAWVTSDTLRAQCAPPSLATPDDGSQAWREAQETWLARLAAAEDLTATNALFPSLFPLAAGLLPPARSDAVAVVRADAFLWPAALFALANGRRVTVVRNGAPDAACVRKQREAASVLVAAQPAAFDAEVLGTLAGITADAGAPLLGILTARDLTAFSALLARSLAPPCEPGPSVLVGAWSARARVDDAALIPLDAFGEDDLRDGARRGTGLFALTTHGDNIDADLNGLVVCGRVARSSAGDAGAAHTCELGEHCRRVVARPRSLLPVDAIRADVLFLETCSGIGLSDGIFPARLSLALGALEGTCRAYVSSTKIVRTTSVGPLLVHDALRDGATFGETARLYARAHRGVCGDEPSYVLIGDPDGRAHAGDGVAVERAVPLAGEDGAALEVRVRGRTTIVTLEGIAPAARIPVRAIESDGAEHADGPVYALPLDDPDAPGALLLVSAGPFRRERVRLRLRRTNDAFDALEALALDVGHNLALLRLFADTVRAADGLRRTDALRRQSEDIDALVAEARDALREGRAAGDDANARVVDVAQPPGAHGERAFALIAAADARFAERWTTWGMGHFTAPFYGPLLSSRGRERHAGPCPLCARASFELQLRAASEPAAARCLTTCARCGLISDRPAGWDPARLDGDGAVERGVASRQELVVPAALRSRSVAGALAFDAAFPWFRSEVRPLGDVTTDSNGGRRLAFEVVVAEDALPGTYYLQGLLVASLGFAFTTKPLVVR